VASLNPGGLLMLGASESLPPGITTLKQIAFDQTIAYRKS
jgi:chemotaxis methyl-accepting protein methylase